MTVTCHLLTCPAPPGCRTLTEADKGRIEKRIDQAIKENQRFERVVVSRDEALEMFQENKFKVGVLGCGMMCRPVQGCCRLAGLTGAQCLACCMHCCVPVQDKSMLRLGSRLVSLHRITGMPTEPLLDRMPRCMWVCRLLYAA